MVTKPGKLDQVLRTSYSLAKIQMVTKLVSLNLLLLDCYSLAKIQMVTKQSLVT